MNKKIKTNLSFWTAILFIFQTFAPLFAKVPEKYDPNVKSLAILPYSSQVEDKVSVEKIAADVRTKLAKDKSLYIVDPKKVEDIVRYNSTTINKPTSLTDAEKYLGLAKNHWFEKQYKEAELTINAAIVSLKNQPQKGDLLVDALLTKSMILKEMNRADESKALFKEALAINPQLTAEGLPVSHRAFGTAKKEFSARTMGGLEIKTDPPGAKVLLNGIEKGVTPLSLKGLPEGSYLLSIQADHYQTLSERVVVTSSATQFLNRKLRWSSATGSSKIRKENSVDEQIKLASSLGDALKVDKVVLVSTRNKASQKWVEIRVFDTTLQAALTPIVVSLEEYQKDPQKYLASASTQIADLAKKNILNNPAQYLEPKSGNVKVLRHKRPFYKTPVFYTLMGVIVGGGIGVTTGILLNDDGGSSGDEGGVDITFR